MHLPVSDRLMTVEEVADFLGVPIATLYQWRHKGTGPVAFRVGRFLRYDPGDVRVWLEAQAGVSHGVG
ncbi:helix-turn-helix domain-containing protein [Nocardioides sp. AE5]|uniref:helix-turn-helix transcriptional regulator n=1 Tax=Nocardioides sp. AE5 TaxID=2962573 RepID=UPI0028812E12|nr:helix-turn-helix domain-containing protein [Nocardioides sp. AE5]MDT0201728.1 helix-turn-helix domain-containing protein [Nocardioides sp. AE5]